MPARKPISTNSEPVLGVDIGGSGIKGALVDPQSGELIGERIRLVTPEGAKPDDVAEVVAELVRKLNYSGPIGCGFPAVVLNGIVMTAANVHETWIGKDINRLLSVATGQAVFTLNDADAAGMAEMRFGVGRQHSHGVVILITIGTGIGSAIFVDGKLVPNTEFGHMEIRGKDAERRASDAARKRKDLSWKEWAERFSEFLNRLEILFWPDLFVLGGGISKETEKYLHFLKVRTKIVPAELENQAGIVGAALYAAAQAPKEQA